MSDRSSFFSPMKLVSSVFKDTVVYGIASLFSKSVALFTFPFLTRYFSINQYGLIDLFYLSITLLISLLSLGQESAILRYFHSKVDDESKRQMISKSLMTQLIIGGGAIISFWILKKLLYKYFIIDSELDQLMSLVLMIIPFGVLQSNIETILRLTFKKKQFLIMTMGFTFSIFIVVFLITNVLKADILELFKFYMLVWVLFGFLGLWFIREWLTMPAHGDVFSKRMLSYGIPMSLITLIGVLQPFLERVALSQTLNSESLGLYAAAAKISMLVTLVAGAFQNAFSPIFMSNYKEQKSILSFNLLFKIYITGLSLILLTLAFCGKSILVNLAGEKYVEGSVIIFPLSLSIFIKSMSLFIGMGIILSKKVTLKLVIYVISLIIGLFAMISITKSFGIVGIAIGSLVGNCVLLILEYYFSQRLRRMSWDLYSFIIILFTIIMGYWLTLINIKTIVGFGSLLFSVLTILTLFWLLISKEDKVFLISYLNFNKNK
jgi:O-antigen/teichoic acid export membrane protein